MLQSSSRLLDRLRKPNSPKSSPRRTTPQNMTTNSHELLKSAISERRQSLSKMEHDVLEDLCEHGSEREAQIAHQSLLSYEASSTISSPGCNHSQGSMRRQYMLTTRKRERSMLWRAHETFINQNKNNRILQAVLRAKMAFTKRSDRGKSDPGRIFPRQQEQQLRAVSAGRADTVVDEHFRWDEEEEEDSSTVSVREDSAVKDVTDNVVPAIPPRDAMMARKASVNNYYRGEGFEIGFVDLSSSDHDEDGDEIRDTFGSQREASIHREEPSFQRPVLMKHASVYHGEGMEVADWNSEWQGFHHIQKIASVLPRSSSFDQSMSYDRVQHRFGLRLRRSVSDSHLQGNANETFLTHIADFQTYDCWTPVEFSILGTSADDIECHPHVLSPPMMETLQAYFPTSRQGQNMWLRYSLVRDGASIHSFLDRVKGSQYSLLAIETVDGEVFGCFTSDVWHRETESFGTGQSFLWRYRHNRHQKTWSVLDQASMEAEIDVYPFVAGSRTQVQLCNDATFGIVGLREPFTPGRTLPDGSFVDKDQWGYGLRITGDVLLEGTSAPCYPFQSPALSRLHSDGSRFEIVNIELWTTTPCLDAVEAERLELKHMFLREHMRPLRT